MKKKIIFGLLFFLFIILIFTSFNYQKKASENYATISISEYSFTLEKAVTPQEKSRGLMFRDMMPEDHGMIFIFDEKAEQSFWMKNTLIPLDIIFIDENKKIVDIKNNVQPCKHDPCVTYISSQPALYVIELNGGTTEKVGLKIGDILEIDNL